MAEKLKTSASTRFTTEVLGRRLVLEVDNDSTLIRGAGESFVKVFPSAADPVIHAVMGSANAAGSNIPERVVDYVSFNNSASAALRYPPNGSVSIQERRFFESAPVVAYNSERNALVLDQEAFGIVKVSYTAHFDRYKVRHGGTPCESPQTQGGTPPEPAATEHYDPAFLVAVADTWETASLTVSGPPCETATTNYLESNEFSDYEEAGLVIEVDPILSPGLYPEYFTTNVPNNFQLVPQYYNLRGTQVKTYAGCRIRVYPQASGLSVVGVNCGVSGSHVEAKLKPVYRALVFSGKHSVGLPYPVQGSITVVGGTQAVDLFGNTVNVTFRRPGETVNEVVWLDSNTFRLVGARTVRDDEVVVVTSSGNNTIPCYTFARAQYMSPYYAYNVSFNWDNGLGWYAAAQVIVSAPDGRQGSLEIDSPSKGGIL